MIRKYMLMMRMEWIFIFVFVYSILQLYYHFSLWWMGIVTIVFIRIICLKNITLTMSAIICSASIMMLAMGQNTRLQSMEQLQLESKEFELIIESDQLDIRLNDDAIRGRGYAIFYFGHDTKRIKVDYIQWLKDSEIATNDLLIKNTVWRVKGKFKKINQARNFFLFDYRDYLRTQGISWQLEITEIINVTQKDTLLNRFKELRYNLLHHFIQWDKNEWIALHNKLLFNVDSDYYRDVKSNFQSLGVAHYFAISGFHIYFIRKVLRYILLRLGMTVERTEFFVSIILIFYTTLIRWPVGVMRVLLMNYLAILSQRSRIPMGTIERLAISGIIILSMNPMYCLSLGFTLSYALTLVVILYNQESSKKTSLIKNVELTLSCLLFSWPVIVQTSYDWNLGQLLFVLLFSVVFNRLIMPLIFVTTLSLIVNPPGFGLFIQVMSQIVKYFEAWNQSTNTTTLFKQTIGYLNEGVFLLLLLSAVFFLIYIHRDSLKVYILVLSVYIALILLVPVLDASTKIILIDVGQGDAILYQKPFNQGMWLIDTGGRANWGENEESIIDREFAYNNLIPALKALGVNRLQGVILTHSDIDHIGNLSSLANEIIIEEIWINQYTSNSKMWLEIQAQMPKIKLNILDLGREYLIDEDTIRVFSIYSDRLKYSSNASNDSSIIVLLSIGDINFLSLGDISKEVEVQMIYTFPNITAEIIKLAHHGSDSSTSKELLDHYQPIFTVTSAGVDNHYGHPHSAVIDLLEETQIPLLLTNEVGAIKIEYHPMFGYKVETALP